MEQNTLTDIAAHVWERGAGELSRLNNTVDYKALTACVNLLSKCKGRIVTSGAGTSGAAARKIAHTLSCIERSSFFLEPADAVHGGLGSVQTGDVAILISKGGGTREIVNIIPALKTKQVEIIGVTEKKDSPLGRNSDIILEITIEKEADEFNMLATTSTMTVLAVFDAVCIALMKETGFTREQFAVIHPGGEVGERLLNDRS